MDSKQSPPPWELESSRRMHEYGMFSVRRDRLRSPRNDEVHEFDIVEAPEGVTVVALTPEGELVLVEQYRPAIRRLSLETPSGLMEEGEDPKEAGLRELREETGFTADEARVIGALVLNPSWETPRVHVVVAEGARCENSRDLDPAEDTRVRTVPRERIPELLKTGAIDSAVVVAALHLAWLQRDQE